MKKFIRLSALMASVSILGACNAGDGKQYTEEEVSDCKLRGMLEAASANGDVAFFEECKAVLGKHEDGTYVVYDYTPG